MRKLLSFGGCESAAIGGLDTSWRLPQTLNLKTTPKNHNSQQITKHYQAQILEDIGGTTCYLTDIGDFIIEIEWA